MSDTLKKYFRTVPKVLKPETNPVLYALLLAMSTSQDEAEEQVGNAKDQLFVRTATGQNLDKIANGLGVSRPPSLGLTDSEYQELIPNLSLKPKAIRKAFYDTSDVFWGPLFSRANVTSNNFAPFNVTLGDVFKVNIDDRIIKEVKVLPGDIAILGAATAEETVAILSKISEITPIVQEDSLTGNKFVNIRTNTPGPVGSLEIFATSMIGVSKLDFTPGKYSILNLDQRVAVYNINPNELLIEIPAIVPALRRTLRGSHHFHLDETLEPPQPTVNGIWAGSFLFNPDGSGANFTVTGQKTELNQAILKGTVYTSLVVNNNSLFLEPFGEVIFGYGTKDQEGPVTYRGIPNTNTLLIDPSYTFKKNHSIGSTINVVSQRKPYIPNRSGKDLAVYLTSPSGAREIVQEILKKLAAAGIILKFKILAPRYKYIIDNPYIDTDDAPGS